ncbi:MAG: hypothetical protein ACFFEE_10400 [Candidatus Thorarchaeota archaeon]
MSKRYREDLERLGVDIDSSQMQVFQAIIKAGGLDRSVTYGEIAKQEVIAEKGFTRAYIYRHLKELEENMFIAADATKSPRRYKVTEQTVSKALEKKRMEKLEQHEEMKQSLTTKLDQLRNIDAEELALMLHKDLAGVATIDNSLVIEGIENVRSTIIREFADGAKEGDLVRVLGHASTLAEGLGPSGVTELRLMQSGFRGVRVYGLMTPISGGTDDPGFSLIQDHLKPFADVMAEAMKTGNIQVRLTQEPVNTYRMVSLNEDKILLYLTHAKESDMAALIHRKDNPGLLDDALRTFDKLWEDGIDIFELAKQTIKMDQ